MSNDRLRALDSFFREPRCSWPGMSETHDAQRNQPDAFMGVSGRRLVGAMRNALPREGRAAWGETVTLIFEGGQAVTFAWPAEGAWWAETTQDLNAAIANRIKSEGHDCVAGHEDDVPAVAAGGSDLA